MFKKATEDEIFLRNPCDGIVIKIDSQQIKKDILSMDEIKQLALTHYSNENPDIRRAFLFCLYGGLRFCDVKDLTFARVDFSNRLLRFNQAKTAGHSSASWVNMPLSDAHFKLIFAVNLLNNGANIKTVASLLGHAGLKHTEKYTRAVDSLKREAIDYLSDISF